MSTGKRSKKEIPKRRRQKHTPEAAPHEGPPPESSTSLVGRTETDDPPTSSATEAIEQEQPSEAQPAGSDSAVANPEVPAPVIADSATWLEIEPPSVDWSGHAERLEARIEQLKKDFQVSTAAELNPRLAIFDKPWPSPSWAALVTEDVLQRLRVYRAALIETNLVRVDADPVSELGGYKDWTLLCESTGRMPDADLADRLDHQLYSKGLPAAARPSWRNGVLRVHAWDSGRVPEPHTGLQQMASSEQMSQSVEKALQPVHDRMEQIAQMIGSQAQALTTPAAQVGRTDEKRQVPRTLDQRRTKIARIKAESPRISARNVCKEMDAAIARATNDRLRQEYAPLPEWIEATRGAKRTWVQLYDDRTVDGKYSAVHNRVKTFVDKIPPAPREFTKKAGRA